MIMDYPPKDTGKEVSGVVKTKNRIEEINKRQLELNEIIKSGSKGREDAIKENEELGKELLARQKEFEKEERVERIKSQTVIKRKQGARMEEIKKRQAELAPLLGESKNISAKEEYDELIKESLSTDKQINNINAEFPEIEQEAKAREAKMSQLREELKKAEKTGKTEEVLKIENQIRDLEKEMKRETITEKNEMAEKEEDVKEVENKEIKTEEKEETKSKTKLIEEANEEEKPEEIPAKEDPIKMLSPEKIESLDEILNNTLKEHNDKLENGPLSSRIKGGVIKGLEKWETFGQGEKGIKGFAKRFTKMAVNLVLIGAISSVSIDQLSKVTTQISATALSGGVGSYLTRKLLFGLGMGSIMEIGGGKIPPKVQKFIPLIMGVGGASLAIALSGTLAAGAVAGIAAGAGYGISKWLKGNFTNEKMKEKQDKATQDLLKKYKDAEGKVDVSRVPEMQKEYLELLKKFDNKKIWGKTLDAVMKLGAGSLVSAITLGASGANMDHIKHEAELNAQQEKPDAVSGADKDTSHQNAETGPFQHETENRALFEHLKTANPDKLAQDLGAYKPNEALERANVPLGSTLKFGDIVVTADKGQGFISLLKELQHEMGDKNINDLPKNEQLTLVYHEAGTNNETILMKDFQVNQYDGKMFDSHPIQTEPANENQVTEQINPETGEPITETAPETLDQVQEQNINHLFAKNMDVWDKIKDSAKAESLIRLGGTNNGLPDELKLLGSYMDRLHEISKLEPLKGEHVTDYENRALPIIKEMGRIDDVIIKSDMNPGEVLPALPQATPDITGGETSGAENASAQVSPEQHVLPAETEPVAPLELKHAEIPVNILGEHILTITDNGSSLNIQFNYDENGNIIDVDAGGNIVSTEQNNYRFEQELQKLNSSTESAASMDIYRMKSEALFLDKLPHDTYEYKFLHNEVAKMQNDIIAKYGNVINPEKLVNAEQEYIASVSPLNTGTENLNQNDDEYVEPGKIEESQINPENQNPLEALGDRPNENVSITENINGLDRTSQIKFIYNENGEVTKHYTETNFPKPGFQRYENIDYSKIDNSEHGNLQIKGLESRVSIMLQEEKLLDKLPHDSPEYKHLYNSIVKQQEMIMRNFGEVLKPEILLKKED